MRLGMNTAKQKISFRGSLADEIAKQLHSNVHKANSLSIMECIARLNPDDLLCISEGKMLMIGKKSDLGKFAPDW
jgi:hypothetical protein